MDRNELTQFWQQNLAEWEASGLSGSAFCKQQSLTYHQFVYWRRRIHDLASAPSSTPRGVGFARATPVAAGVDSDGLTLSLPGGISICGLHAGNISLLGAILRQL